MGVGVGVCSEDDDPGVNVLVTRVATGVKPKPPLTIDWGVGGSVV